VGQRVEQANQAAGKYILSKSAGLLRGPELGM
jgi:hypothetical protein